MLALQLHLARMSHAGWTGQGPTHASSSRVINDPFDTLCTGTPHVELVCAKS